MVYFLIKVRPKYTCFLTKVRPKIMVILIKVRPKEHKNRDAHNHEHPCSAYLQPELFAGFDSDVILC